MYDNNFNNHNDPHQAYIPEIPAQQNVQQAQPVKTVRKKNGVMKKS